MNFLTNMSLWKKIFILTALGLALGVGVFSTLGMRAVNQATEAMLQERLTTTQIVADYLDEALTHAQNELAYSAGQLGQLQPNTQFDEIPGMVENLKQRYQRLSIHASGVYLLDSGGQILYSDPETAPTNAFETYLASEIDQAVNSNKISISRMVSISGFDPVVFLVAPVTNQSTSDKAVLAVAVDLAQSNMGLFVRPLKLGQTGYIEIVDQSGTVMIRTQPGPKLLPFEKSDHSTRFAALIDAGKPTRGICHTCHEPNQTIKGRDVLAFVPLQVAHWGVVIRQSENEALTPSHTLLQNIIFFGLGLVSVALLFVVVTTRDVGSRIKMLTVASRKIANGDLTSPVASLGRDEVGILAQTFDDMRSELKTSYGDLEQKTRELTALLSVSQILTSPLDLPSLLDAVVSKAVEVIAGSDGGLLLIKNSESGIITVQSTIGLDKLHLTEAFFNSKIELGEDNLADASNSELKENLKEMISPLLQSAASGAIVRNSAMAKIYNRNSYIGVLVVFSCNNAKTFSESDNRLLQAIAEYISIAVERDQLAREADKALALHETDRLRSQFISSVSHELRTPLTIIKGYATSLLRKNVVWDKDTQTEFLTSIDVKTDELRDLIDKILQSAKLEAGALKLEKEPILLTRIARKVIEETAQRTKKHEILLDFPQPFPILEADARCMEQVLRNLIENAVKYSPEGGKIVVKGEVHETEIIISVSDQGVGIPVSNQDKVFERFFRVDSPLTRRTTGSGLGLSICKGHIKAHGGQIWFESSVGKGSQFYFSLPLNPSEVETPPEKEVENGG